MQYLHLKKQVDEHYLEGSNNDGQITLCWISTAWGNISNRPGGSSLSLDGFDTLGHHQDFLFMITVLSLKIVSKMPATLKGRKSRGSCSQQEQLVDDFLIAKSQLEYRWLGYESKNKL